MKVIFSGKQEVYLEVAEKYENYIKLGVMKYGDKLPTVREAAAQMGINPNTMAKSYNVLEQRGLIRAIPKKGVYVIYGEEAYDESDKTAEEEQRRHAICVESLMHIKAQGATKDDVLKALEEVYSDDKN